MEYTTKKPKKFSPKFLMLINLFYKQNVSPGFQFVYAKWRGLLNQEPLLTPGRNIHPEINGIVSVHL